MSYNLLHSYKSSVKIEVFLIWLVIFLVIACSSPKLDDKKPLIQPVQKTAVGFTVPESRTKPPVKIQAGKPYEVIVKGKTAISERTSVFPVKDTLIVKMKDPVKKSPGMNGLKLPAKRSVTSIKNLCKAPVLNRIKPEFTA